MKINIPYSIGDVVTIDGKKQEVRGIHIYITADEKILKYRLHIGNGKFITIKSENLPQNNKGD